MWAVLGEKGGSKRRRGGRREMRELISMQSPDCTVGAPAWQRDANVEPFPWPVLIPWPCYPPPSLHHLTGLLFSPASVWGLCVGPWIMKYCLMQLEHEFDQRVKNSWVHRQRQLLFSSFDYVTPSLKCWQTNIWNILQRQVWRDGGLSKKKQQLISTVSRELCFRGRDCIYVWWCYSKW